MFAFHAVVIAALVACLVDADAIRLGTAAQGQQFPPIQIVAVMPGDRYILFITDQ